MRERDIIVFQVVEKATLGTPIEVFPKKPRALSEKTKKGIQTSMKEYWNHQPLENRRTRIREAKRAQADEMDERMKQTLGEDPSNAFNTLKKQGYADREIATMKKTPHSTLQHWKKHWREEEERKRRELLEKATTTGHFIAKSDRDLWNAVMEGNLLPIILKEGYLTQDQVDIFKFAFRKEGRVRLREELLLKLSLAVTKADSWLLKHGK